MKILRGGSAEVTSNKWFKFDIELDESDLQAIVVKNDIDTEKLTVGQKYSVLTKQAEILVTIQMESQGLVGELSSRELMQEFNTYVGTLPKVA